MAQNNINIGVGVNTGELKTGMDEAAKIIKKGGEAMSTAITAASNQSGTATRNLQQQFRAASKDAQILYQTMGGGSAAFIEAANKAGKLKDKLSEVKAVTKAFANDSVLGGVLPAMTAMAGAFSAAQGAMALFGEKNEDVQKALLKVQGAMALLQGLTALGGYKDALLVLNTTITARVIPSLVAMNATLMANPWTVVAVAVVAIGAGLITWARSQDEVTQATIRYNESQKKTIGDIHEKTKAVREHNAELAIQLAALKNGTTEDAERLKLVTDEIAAGELKLKNEKRLGEEQLKLGVITEQQHEANIYGLTGALFALKAYAGELKKIVPLENELKKLQDSKKEKKVGPQVAGFTAMVEITPRLSKWVLPPLDTKKFNVEIERTLSENSWRFDEFIIAMKDAALELKDALNDLAIQGFMALGNAIGESMAGGDVNFGENIKKGLADLMNMISFAMISMGVAYKVTGIGIGYGLALVGAGVALSIAAGALSASASKKSAGGGGSSGRPEGPSYGSIGGQVMNQGVLNLSGVVQGSNILITSQRASYNRGRTK